MANTIQINYWTIGGFEATKRPEQALEEAKKMGFDGLELAFGAGEFAPGIGEARCKEIAKAAKALGMKIDSLASGAYWGLSLASEDAGVRKAAVDFTREYMQVAKWVGAKTVLVIPGAVAVPWDASQPVIPYETVWKNATASVKKLVPVAEKLGVNIGIENVWNWFLYDPMSMRTFIDQFKSSRVGAYFDIANCLINGFPQHWIEMLGKRIKAIHLKNFSREDCGGVLHGFGDDIAKGDVDWKAVNAALKKIKYSGPLTAEMVPFSRLPNMVLPDMDLAADTAKKVKQLVRV